MIVSPSLRSCIGEKFVCDTSPRSGSDCASGARIAAGQAAPASGAMASATATPAAIALAASVYAQAMTCHDEKKPDAMVLRCRPRGGVHRDADTECRVHAIDPQLANRFAEAPVERAATIANPIGILPTSTRPGRRTWSTWATRMSRKRVARAGGRIAMAAATLAMIRDGSAKKGDVLGVARIAAIQAAKRTSDLIPLAHPLMLTRVQRRLRLR